jgi:endonuclease/exonuclease/phosphatase family metal-dependent hydrolase
VSYVPENYLPKDWSWVYCDTLPTNRRVVHPYNRENTLTTTIDFFLISPNVKSEGIRVLDKEFQHSDHEPVVAKFALN